MMCNIARSKGSLYEIGVIKATFQGVILSLEPLKQLFKGSLEKFLAKELFCELVDIFSLEKALFLSKFKCNDTVSINY